MTPNANVPYVVVQILRASGRVQCRTGKDYVDLAAATKRAKDLSRSESHRYEVMTGADFDAACGLV